MTISIFKPARDGFSPLAVSTIAAHEKYPLQGLAWCEESPTLQSIRQLTRNMLFNGSYNLWENPNTFTQGIAALINPNFNSEDAFEEISTLPLPKRVCPKAYFIRLGNAKVTYNSIILEHTLSGKSVIYYSTSCIKVIKEVCLPIFKRDFKEIIDPKNFSQAKELSFTKHFNYPPPISKISGYIKEIPYPAATIPTAYNPREIKLRHYGFVIYKGCFRIQVLRACIIIILSIIGQIYLSHINNSQKR